MRNKITVNIAGQSYTLVAAEDAAYMEKVASHVDAKIQEVLETSKVSLMDGAMLGALGFSLVSLLNEDKRVPMEMSPFFIALFAFCFALACGVVWEIYEFTLDGIMQLNMQKYALQDGTLIVGRAALLDTMEDLIVDTLGALAVCVVGYISLKKSRARKKKAEAEEKNERDLPLDEGRGTVVN